MDLTEEMILNGRERNRIRVITNFLNDKVSRKSAAQILNLSERTVSRIAKRVTQVGVEGVLHRGRRRAPQNRFPDEIRMGALKLYKQKFFDMNMTHALEFLTEQFHYQISYSTFRRWCHQIKLVKRKHKRRRQPQRDLRTRMPEEGLMLQMDGSHHWFIPEQKWCLITAIDDATNEICYGEFFDSETTEGCMKVLRSIIELKGIPISIYVDRAGWSGGGKRVHFSQFQRACEELGIEVIYANSPQAKGRIERAFGTIQDRLVPLFRTAKIKTKSAATDFFNEIFLPFTWQKKFTVPARKHESRYLFLPSSYDLNDVFCLKFTRKMGLDRTFSFRGNRYYVDPNPLFKNVHMKQVEVRVYDEDDWAAFYQGVIVPVYEWSIGWDGAQETIRPIRSKKMERSYEIYL